MHIEFSDNSDDIIFDTFLSEEFQEVNFTTTIVLSDRLIDSRQNITTVKNTVI